MAGGSSARLQLLQATAGLVAAAAALIYITGGVVLELRLLFGGLPSLDVVGDLPRSFLFSVGASQVVIPAIVIGVVVGALEFGQHGDVVLWKGHVPFGQTTKKVRTTYTTFRSVVPLIILGPGAAYALARDDGVRMKLYLFVILGGFLLLGLVVLVRAAWRSRLDRKNPARHPRCVDKKGELRLRDWVLTFIGGSLALVPVLWILISGPESNAPRYFGLVAAWLVTLLFVLLFMWLRGELGDAFRRSNDNLVARALLSWCATALLVIPGLVALSAALPFTNAVVCTKRPGSPVRGQFVGETNTRVYIGVADRLDAFPVDEVSRLILGGSARVEQCADTLIQGASTSAIVPDGSWL